MNFVIRLVMKSIVLAMVVVMMSMLPIVKFGAAWEAVAIGIFVAISVCLIELVLLKEKTLWLVTIVDVVYAAGVIYLCQDFFPGSKITTLGAILTAVGLGIFEHMHHLFLTRGWNPGARRKAKPKQ